MTASKRSEVPGGDGDPIRERLLDAAAAVFARQGFDGTKILDIVREAGLSTGAIYGRFESKQALLREAVVRHGSHIAGRAEHADETRVAELVKRTSRIVDAPLTDAEAVLLEAYVTARREPEVARALAEARERRIEAVTPFMEKAKQDGSLADGVDAEAVMFLLRVLRLGTLLHRAAGLPMPKPESWDALVAGMVASFGETRTDEDPS
jgi:AcrR family transcriptional regulator